MKEVRELEEKEKKIKREVARLTKIFQDIEPNRRLASKGLIDQAAFMRITLNDLIDEINIVGPVDEMPQGDYSILREHPALKSYNAMVQRYSTIIKQLIDSLPKEQQNEVNDGFEDFLNAR